MRKIDVLKTGRLTDIIGPVGTLRRILKNHNYFESNGLDISIYNMGRFFRDWNDNESNNQTTKRFSKKCFRSKLDNWAKNSFLLSMLLVERKYRDHKKFVKRYLAENRTPDILICHAEIECYYFLKLNKRKEVKTILFFHNDGIPMKMYSIYYPRLIGSWYMRLLLKRYEYTITHVDKCAFICGVGMKNINSYYPVSIDKSFLIINGIDDLTPQELKEVSIIKNNRKNDCIEICCVGSVSVRKAQRLVIQALAYLPQNLRQKYHLTIVGDGTDMDYCKELVKINCMEEQVTFTGSIPNNEVYRYLACADIFVLLSQNEGLPISIIEAMRAGLAIVSTNVSGIPELVAFDNGILIEPSAKSFASILNQPDTYNWKEMGINSRKAFEEKFTFKRMREDYVKMINSLYDN